MIEFVLSKVWTVIFALAMVGSLLLAFQCIDGDRQAKVLEEEMEEMVNLLEEMRQLQPGSSFQLELHTLLEGGEILEICGHRLRLSKGELSIHSPIETIFVPAGQGHLSNDFWLSVTANSSLWLEVQQTPEGRALVIQLEKSSTISFSLFDKERHSSVLL